jgi:hypothetical protein
MLLNWLRPGRPTALLPSIVTTGTPIRNWRVQLRCGWTDREKAADYDLIVIPGGSSLEVFPDPFLTPSYP